MRTSITTRIADKSRKWVTYDPDHAFEILVFITEKSNALAHNFIPICHDNQSPMDTVEAKLYLFSVTFEKLASRYIQEMSHYGERLPPERVTHGLEEAKLFAEAALICDRYFLASFVPAAWGWVLKDNDIIKAITILDEGIRRARDMERVRPHKASLFDEQLIKDRSDWVECMEAVKGVLKLDHRGLEAGSQ